MRVAQADSSRRYSVDLEEEDENGGHTLKYHVAKNDVEVRALLEAQTIRTPTSTAFKAAESAFSSREAANDFVNRVLEANKSVVDSVASGNQGEKWLSRRFGYVTGSEAFRQGAIENIVVRKTYNAGVLIRHDSRSPRGYRVITAYPFNDDTE